MARKAFPNRFEQAAIYRRILEGFGDQPVTIRTLDIGGDKGLPYFQHPAEENPFMGWRAIRISLECREIFREQLAAIFMAAAASPGRARIMFPMVSGLEEVREIKEIVAGVMDELQQSGVPYRGDIPLGIMVEIPAAVQIAELLGKEVDFFSIGTNDLIQYTMAADRNNPKVKSYYNSCHPAVLHSIKRVADAARTCGISVSLCGEMAADPISAILLLGLGISDLSMSSPSIPLVKLALQATTLADARQISQRVLAMGSNREISTYLKEVGLDLGIVS
jgi:phosphotransferase system enzyme I (PtsP)